MTSRRPKIFCQFSDRNVLEPISGDRINEIRFYRSLSSFADVYYNDTLIDWSTGQIGDPAGLNPPSRNYDLYYVRANPSLLKSLPHPKVTMAYPYDPDTFGKIDGLIVTTDAWRELLLAHPTSDKARAQLAKWYPDAVIRPDAIINVQQTLDPMFLKPPNSKRQFYWRTQMTGAKAFGFFGRISDETLPSELLDSVQTLQETSKDVGSPMSVLAGSIRTRLPKNAINLGSIDYTDMPNALSTCRGTLGQYCADSEFLGSGKILDSMASGVPIVTRINPVRIEQLGDYPGIYKSQQEAETLLRDLTNDDDFHAEMSQKVRHRAEHFVPAATGARIHNRLQDAGLLPQV
ncbi:hypothetical protein [Algirhabdus cladophorae]|uniref:hypothetical protein n=1 Tax=Algirhabdus cladophorae TaxID=3377108 RepID=UPI003B846FF7